MISLKTLWIIVPLITASCAYEVCYKKSFGSSLRTLYCSDSCCGSSYSRYCCTRYSYTGVYTGSGFGTVALIAIIVTCICCCRRRQAQQGRLMATNQLAVVSTSTMNTGVVNQGFQYPAQPPVYYPQPAPMAQPPPAYSTVMAGQPYPPMAGSQYQPTAAAPFSTATATTTPLQNETNPSKSSAPPYEEHAYTPLA